MQPRMQGQLLWICYIIKKSLTFFCLITFTGFEMGGRPPQLPQQQQQQPPAPPPPNYGVDQSAEQMMEDIMPSDFQQFFDDHNM